MLGSCRDQSQPANEARVRTKMSDRVRIKHALARVAGATESLDLAYALACGTRRTGLHHSAVTPKC
jgi:hypothetical protein